MRGGGGEQVYERLLSGLHNNNKGIKELSLGGATIQRGAFGEMVGNVLQRNTSLTALKLKSCRVNVEFIRAMRNGLLASRGRLKSLSFCNVSV